MMKDKLFYFLHFLDEFHEVLTIFKNIYNQKD